MHPSRFALGLALAAGSLGAAACGGTYYEHDGIVTTGPPNVTYADPSAAAAVQDAQATAGETGAYAAEDVDVGASSSTYEDTDPSALTEFRGTLDPYGTWVDDGTYGTVWVPSATVVGADFAPYVTAGHWVYEDEYVWVSDYDWGWAPFHYGRWAWMSGYGWGWIPGRRYAGAWVSWRVGYDGWGYVGWGPLAPSWYWRGGYAVGMGFAPTTPWVYCAHGDLFHPMVGGRLVASAQVGAVAAHARPWVPAQPGVAAGGRGVANPSVSGPPPGELGIRNAPRTPAGHAGLLKAQAYSRPSSAQAYGARPPATAPSRTTLPSNRSLAPVVRGPTALPGSVYSTRSRPGGGDAYTARPPSHYGPPSAYGRPNTSVGPRSSPDGSAAFRSYAPPTQVYRPTQTPTYAPPAQAFRPTQTPTYAPPAQAFRPMQTPTYAPPSQAYSPSSRFGASGGSFAPAPHFSGGSGMAPAGRGMSPSVSRPSVRTGGTMRRR